MAESSTTSQTELRYTDNPEFNEWLDGQSDDLIHILDGDYRPSELLYFTDREMYRNGLESFKVEHVQPRINERALQKMVLDHFPTPIAYSFHRFLKGYENEIQRLYLLRDTWESLIFLLYALVVSEFRCFAYPFTGTRLSEQLLFSDSIRAKLNIIEQLLKLAAKNGYDLACAAVIPLAGIQQLQALNRLRNDVQHAGAKSERQARDFIARHQDEVFAALSTFRRLKEVKLLKYAVGATSIYSLHHQPFVGPFFNQVFADLSIPPDKLTLYAPYLTTNNRVLVYANNRLFSLAPFVHMVTDATGNWPKLCYYKQTRSAKLIYEIAGESNVIEEDEADFKFEIDQLLQLLPVLPPKGTGSS